MSSCSQISEIIPLLEKWAENPGKFWRSDQLRQIKLVAWNRLFGDAKIQDVGIFIGIESKNVFLR